MTVFEQNILSALAIGIVIATMSMIKRDKWKATVYSLPVPMTIALVATGGSVSTATILGLLLVMGFLWSTCFLYHRGVPIIIADIIAAVTYIFVGYVVTQAITIPFYWAVAGYFALWVLFVTLYGKHLPVESVRSKTKIKPTIKGGIVSVIAFGLLSFKTALSGVIVTFPFSGVFAVIEGRQMLHTLAAVVSRNSLSALVLFISVYAFSHLALGTRLMIGWLACLITLHITTKLFPLTHRSSSSGNQ